ncbi:hypothetical protein Tco_0559399 [Tanacetum coccineum]
MGDANPIRTLGNYSKPSHKGYMNTIEFPVGNNVFEADFKQQQSEMTNKIDTVLKAITDRIAGALPSDTVKNLKLKEKDSSENTNTNPSASLDPSVLFIIEKFRNQFIFQIAWLGPKLSGIKLVCTKGDDGDVMFIEIVKKTDDSRKEEPEAGGLEVEYFDTFLTRS